MRTWLAIVLTTGLTTGCILPVPTPHGKILEGAEVTSSDLTLLQPTVTTKAEVMQRLGPPAIFWRDENTLIYRWVQRKGVLLWAIGGGYSADFGAMDITAEFAFLVKFDETDRFARSETLRKPAGKSFGQFLLDWRDARRSKVNAPKETKP